MASGSLVGRASTLATSGARGATIVAAARAWAISSAAGCMSGQWKGAETFSGMARAPSSLALAMAASTAALSPEITTLPWLLSLATTQTPTAEPALAELQLEHERLMRRIGLAPETRKFTPHVTLARLRATSSLDVADYLAARGFFRTAPFPVTRFVLFSSRASTGGGPYVVEEEYPLIGA